MKNLVSLIQNFSREILQTHLSTKKNGSKSVKNPSVIFLFKSYFDEAAVEGLEVARNP